MRQLGVIRDKQAFSAAEVAWEEYFFCGPSPGMFLFIPCLSRMTSEISHGSLLTARFRTRLLSLHNVIMYNLSFKTILSTIHFVYHCNHSTCTNVYTMYVHVPAQPGFRGLVNSALLWQKEASDIPSKFELLVFSYFT